MKFILLIAAACTLLTPSPLAQRSGDRGYVEFCLKHMSPLMRQEIQALRYVLTPFEFDEVLALSTDDDRRRWIDEYWSVRDPIFTTSENELRVEHDQRVAYARSEFFIPRSPMWDDRGEVFIRYGPPSYRLPIAPETGAERSTPRGEVWYYGDHDMVVLFEDVFSRGEFTSYIGKFRGASRTRANRIGDEIDDPVRHVPHPDDPIIPPDLALMAEYNQHIERIGKYYEMLESTPCVFSCDLPARQQPFVFSIDHFRGGQRIDRVDVNVELEADLRAASTSERTRKYTATAVVWDTRRNEVGRRESAVELTALGGDGEAGPVRLVPLQIVFSLPPGFYHAAVTVEDRTLGKISSRRTDLTCEDFESKLAVSDLLFAASIEPTEEASPFRRGAWVVIPHPLRKYQRFGSIPVYFEIYNLAVGAGGASTYTVEYQIVRREPGDRGGRPVRTKEPRPEFSSSFTQSTYGSLDVVHIALKSDNLREGAFDLRVKITDDVTRAVAAREASFSVVE
jgi:GWxTD domain-containing protein